MPPLAQLQELGLSPSEAIVYTVLLRRGSLGAQAIAEHSALPRSSVYPILRSLREDGMLEATAGYGSRYRAVPAQEAIDWLLERRREELEAHERSAEQLKEQLAAMASEARHDDEEVIEILRDRRAIRQRFIRLQRTARREIDGFVKPPIMVTTGRNAEEVAALRRGVTVRSLYEPAVLSQGDLTPHIGEVIAAGEEARVYPGRLPLKLALFDAESAFLPLEALGQTRGSAVLVIRHAGLGLALRLLFDALWSHGTPFDPASMPDGDGRSAGERGRARKTRQTV